MVFDDLYSDRLNIIKMDRSSKRVNRAFRFSYIQPRIGDIIFAFFDTVMWMVFRPSSEKLIWIGCAIFVEAENFLQPENHTKMQNKFSELAEGAIVQDTLLAKVAFGDLKFGEDTLEHEIEISSSDVACILSCYTAGYELIDHDASEQIEGKRSYDRPPTRFVES